MSDNHRESRELQPHRPPDGISVDDYEAIEDAVMETARGRWFLKEYARRMRAAETQSLRASLERIEKMVALTQAPRADAQTQIHMREQMQGVSERLLDISWYMRERGFTASICASIDEEARQLARLCEGLQTGAADEAIATPEGSQPYTPDDPEQGGGEIIEHVAAQSSETTPNPVTEQPRPAAQAPCAAVFVHIDAMPVRQRLAMFA